MYIIYYMKQGDEACKLLLKKKIAEQNQIHEYNGHKFKTKEFCSNITACSYCHDGFWGTSQGQECQGINIIIIYIIKY